MIPPLPSRLRSRDRSRHLAHWLNASLTLLALVSFGLTSWLFAATHPGASASSAAPAPPAASPSYPSSALPVIQPAPVPSLAPAPPHAAPVAVTGGSHPKP